MTGYGDDHLAWKDLNGEWGWHDAIDQAIVQSFGIPPAQVQSIAGGVYNKGGPVTGASEITTISPAEKRALAAEEANQRLTREFSELKRGYDRLWCEKYARKEESVKTGPPPNQVEVRIGDAARSRYIEHLGNMFSGGFLTQEEFEHRMNMAAEARHESHLKTLVEDLPPLPSPFRGEPVVLKQPLLKTWKTPAVLWMFAAVAWICVFSMITVR